MPALELPITSDHFKQLATQCIHCGMCLQVCPTYTILGTEMDAPRGRIALMRAASEGRIPLSELQKSFAQHMELCLACRACETICPSGVKYGELIELTQQSLQTLHPISVFERLIRWAGLKQLMPHRRRLIILSRLSWLYEKSGLQFLVRQLGFLPRPLSSLEAILPPLSNSFGDYSQPAPAIGEKRGEVAFFIGCIQEAFLAPINLSTVHLLQRNGYEVHFPQGQTCCGAAQAHLGEKEAAQQMARSNIDAFLARDYLAVITNAGGCGSMLYEEYPRLMEDDPKYAPLARQLAAKVLDISQFLANPDHLHKFPTGKLDLRVTYADSCHLRHVQKVSLPPRDLIRLIPGVKLVEIKKPDRCCGSAGVYNIIHADLADPILDLKMADIASTQPDLIVTGNVGCHMQLIAGVRKAGLQAKVVHLAELLEMSYAAGE